MKNLIAVNFEKMDKSDFTPSVALKVYTSCKIAHMLYLQFGSDMDVAPGAAAEKPISMAPSGQVCQYHRFTVEIPDSVPF